ncbi:hypothetical protein Pcinc_022801 [Petrolisthes cinctipes]|uniref:Uncharacterized protein n=1 Tax=Petrolisthes cinctipes TaxID=88211 RepID=A0AAE1FFL9_PETCI|nr:hypothetical protein Pcinc_022801 [Petrolisthes cinctipes]
MPRTLPVHQRPVLHLSQPLSPWMYGLPEYHLARWFYGRVHHTCCSCISEDNKNEFDYQLSVVLDPLERDKDKEIQIASHEHTNTSISTTQNCRATKDKENLSRDVAVTPEPHVASILCSSPPSIDDPKPSQTASSPTANPVQTDDAASVVPSFSTNNPATPPPAPALFIPSPSTNDPASVQLPVAHAPNPVVPGPYTSDSAPVWLAVTSNPACNPPLQYSGAPDTARQFPPAISSLRGNLLNNVIFGNIEGLIPATFKSKLPLLCESIYHQDTLIVALTESHLNHYIKDAEVTIAGYTSFCTDRTNTTKGGVITYIKEELPPYSEVILSSSTSNIEAQVLHIKRLDLILITIYRSPACTDFKTKLENIRTVLDKIPPPSPTIFITVPDLTFSDLNFYNKYVDWDALRAQIAAIDWLSLLTPKSVDAQHDTILSQLLEACITHVPQRSSGSNTTTIPRDRRALMCIRTRLRKMSATNQHDRDLINAKIGRINTALVNSVSNELHLKEARPTLNFSIIMHSQSRKLTHQSAP